MSELGNPRLTLAVDGNHEGRLIKYFALHGAEYSPGEFGWLAVFERFEDEVSPTPISVADVLDDLDRLVSDPEVRDGMRFVAKTGTEAMIDALEAGKVAPTKYEGEPSAEARLDGLRSELAAAFDEATVSTEPALGEGVTQVSIAGVKWVDVDLVSAADPAGLIADSLRQVAPNVDDHISVADRESLIADLIDPDEWPEVTDYGPIHKLSVAWMVPPVVVPRDGSEVDLRRPTMLDVTRVEIAVGDGWIMSAWHPVERLTEPSDDLQPVMTGVEALRDAMAAMVKGAVTRRSLTGSGDIAVAMMAAAVSTFAEHRKLLHGRIDDWEHEFYLEHFSEASNDVSTAKSNKAARERARQATKTLAEVHAAAVDLSKELDQMTAPREQAAVHWAGEGNFTTRGEALAEAIDEKIDRQRISLRDLRDRVRAGLDLAHTVDSTRRDAESRKRDSFIAKVAAVFLAPTLIAGFYGINTKYPDVGTTNGTIEALVFMVLSAVMAWGAIALFDRRGGD